MFNKRKVINKYMEAKYNKDPESFHYVVANGGVFTSLEDTSIAITFEYSFLVLMGDQFFVLPMDQGGRPIDKDPISLETSRGLNVAEDKKGGHTVIVVTEDASVLKVNIPKKVFTVPDQKVNALEFVRRLNPYCKEIDV